MKPRLLFTMGDVAGVGPEILAKAWPELVELCEPRVVGDAGWLKRGLELAGSTARVVEIQGGDGVPSSREISCLQATSERLDQLTPGKISPAAGQAAYDFLCTAIDLTLAGSADGIVTCPLHKEGLHAAGLIYPGHTEILAKRTGTRDFAMALYVPPPYVPGGLAVVHVTLHMALREVFGNITTAGVFEKIRLLDGLLHSLGKTAPRLGVAALNPHASDGGIFGDEEERLVAPAVRQAQKSDIRVSGPWPSDTLFVRAHQGEFDGIVAMYHDQGHIALKLLGGLHAVNISVGLPLVRTSVAHGTAYDIAGQGRADARSLVEAARVAAQLASGSRQRAPSASR